MRSGASLSAGNPQPSANYPLRLPPAGVVQLPGRDDGPVSSKDNRLEQRACRLDSAESKARWA